MARRAGIGALVALAGLTIVGGGGASHAQPPLGGLDPASRAASIEGRIADIMGAIERRSARKARIDAEIAGLGDRRAAARDRLRERTRALYRLDRAGMLPLAGGFEALLRHLARVERLERMVEDDLDALRSLRTRGEALRAETGELAATVEDLNEELRALRGRQVALGEDQRLGILFDQALADGAPSWDSAPDLAPGYGTLRVVDDTHDPDGHRFLSMRGRLGMPVTGPADVRDAQREDGSGLEMLVPSGTSVRAVAEGRVAFAQRYGGYGRLVILDHGGSYYTVYAGLGSMGVRVGEYVARGGTVGDVGADTVPTALYFEVRRGTRSLDAASWIGL